MTFWKSLLVYIIVVSLTSTFTLATTGIIVEGAISGELFGHYWLSIFITVTCWSCIWYPMIIVEPSKSVSNA